MVYIARNASPPLDAYIERIWYCSDPAPHARERVLPSGGSVGLGINLADSPIDTYELATPELARRHSGAIVSGTFTRSYLVDPRQRVAVLGVHFRPGRVAPFLGVSPAELVDSHVALDELWGSAARSLRDQLLEAGSASEQFRIVEAALLNRLRRAREGHPAAYAAVQALRGGGNELRVTQVATDVGLSQRRFIQIFEREVGLTPKLYARLQRFHRVKQRIAALGEPASWAGLALACGYFDQSHMIRDFVAFSGMSPTGYLRSQTEETQFDRFIHAYEQSPGADRPR